MLADPAYAQCGGNYDARNYLDAYDVANAISGEVNYFAGGINNRVSFITDDKRFVLADSDHYDDRFLFVTSDDIFTPLIRRSDFAAAIYALMNNASFASIPIAGNKGTDNFACGTDDFCRNWREMLFLTQLPAHAPVVIDGLPSGNCNRVLLFSGARIAGQSRVTAAEKSDKNNYLENINLASFNTPVANAANFSGASAFNWHNPGADLIRCLP